MDRSWVYRSTARYGAEGETAFEPRSRRPKTSPRATPPTTVELVVALRKQLIEAGHDAGVETSPALTADGSPSNHPSTARVGFYEPRDVLAADLPNVLVESDCQAPQVRVGLRRSAVPFSQQELDERDGAQGTRGILTRGLDELPWSESPDRHFEERSAG